MFKFRKGVISRKILNQNFLWICTSTHYLLHNYKVSGNSVEWFQRSWSEKNCFYSIFHFGQMSKFKKRLIPRKRKCIKISCKYTDLHIISFISTKFHGILLSGFRGVALTNCSSSIFNFGKISKFKKGVFPRKKNDSKFPVDMHIYMIWRSQLQRFTKFCSAVSGELRWQEKQDWLTDWLTDTSKTLYPQQLTVIYFPNHLET